MGLGRLWLKNLQLLNGNLGYVKDGKDLTIFNSKVTMFNHFFMWNPIWYHFVTMEVCLILHSHRLDQQADLPEKGSR
jgi:hypothetical protein